MNEASSLLHFLKAGIGLPYPLCIAGGYARDQVLGIRPRDIDVFLLDAEGKYLDFSARLKNEHVIHVIDNRTYAMPKGKINPFDPAVNFDFLGWKVQVMATACHSPQEVVDTFDYDVCQFWLDEFSLKPCGRHNDSITSLVNRQMRLQHVNTPWSSLRRGILMADRFGFEFRPADCRRLVEAMHAELQR